MINLAVVKPALISLGVTKSAAAGLTACKR